MRGNEYEEWCSHFPLLTSCLLLATAQLQNTLAESGLNVTLNESLVILVSTEVPLDNVLLTIQEYNNGSANASAAVVALNNGSYGLSDTPTVLTGQITLIGGQTQSFQTAGGNVCRLLESGKEAEAAADLETERRRLLQKHYPHFQGRKRKLTVAGSTFTVIEAPANLRCISFSNGNLQTDLIVFTGTPSAAYAGGVEVLGAVAQATFVRTAFLSNRWSTQGGGLTLTGGSKVTLGR